MMKIFGFAGYSGSGKTTLIEQMIPLFVEKGLRVSLIKHAHHEFDVDIPGKDSYRHRKAGCAEVLVAGGQRWALMHELRDEPEPVLGELLAHFSPCDLVLVEGFKKEPIPKLEIYRQENGKPMLFTLDPYIVGVATDGPINTNLPLLDINQPQVVADFILNFLELK